MAGIEDSSATTGEGDRGQGQGQEGPRSARHPDKNRVLVEACMMVKKHVKPNPQKNIKGGIAEQEAPIHVSNVMLV
jgi:large subunit ribosomal protein L24